MENVEKNKKPKIPENLHLEVTRKFIESKEVDELIECLNGLLLRAENIGIGDNADVFALKEGKLNVFCLKKMKKTPKIVCNGPEDEFEYQNRINRLGIKTPQTLALVQDTTNKENYLIMERIKGPSLKNVLEENFPIPENYNHKVFFEKLKKDIEKMHEANIHHRDLHSGNVMIDENGNPVIIDFGTATIVFSGDEHPYRDQVPVLNASTGRYDIDSGFFKSDMRQFSVLEAAMRSWMK